MFLQRHGGGSVASRSISDAGAPTAVRDILRVGAWRLLATRTRFAPCHGAAAVVTSAGVTRRFCTDRRPAHGKALTDHDLDLSRDVARIVCNNRRRYAAAFPALDEQHSCATRCTERGGLHPVTWSWSSPSRIVHGPAMREPVELTRHNQHVRAAQWRGGRNAQHCLEYEMVKVSLRGCILRECHESQSRGPWMTTNAHCCSATLAIMHSPACAIPDCSPCPCVVPGHNTNLMSS